MEFLKFVIEDLYKRFDGHLENVTVVLPTRRASLFVKKYLAEQVGDKPICAPECTTMTDLFDTLCPLKPADEIKTVCLLYDIYKQKMSNISIPGHQLTLDNFYSWGRQLISDFNNIDKNYIDSNGTDILKISAEAHEFDKDNLDPEVKERIRNLMRGHVANQIDKTDYEDSFKKIFEQIWSALPDIYTELSKMLQKENCALEGARNKWVVNNFENLWREMNDTTFAFAGFNILLGTERKFMQLVKREGKALFYWDYDQTFHESETYIPAYHNVANDVEEFGGEYEKTSDNNERTINIVSANSANAQARYVHDWLINNHKEGQSSAVVLCDETMLQPVVFSIPEKFSEKVNITKGFPMKNTRIYARICSWFKNANTPDNPNVIADILHNLRDFIDREWESTCSQSAQSEESSADTSYEWYEMLDRESIFQSRCIVSRFISLVEEGVFKEVKEFYTIRNLLTAHLGMVSIPFHGEPITDVQIMGVLETRTLDFDNVLLLNVEEGVVPQSGHDHSFIPYYLRKYYNLTTLDDQAQVYSYNFFRILRRAHNVTLLYSEAMTSNEQKSMSRFVMQILASSNLRKYVTRSKLVTSSVARKPESLPSAVEPVANDKTRQLTSFSNYKEKLLNNKKNHPERPLSLSPSAINTYLRCKRSFFMKYMLGLKEPVNSGNFLQANELGTLVHESVRAAYNTITEGRSAGTIIPPDLIKTFLKNPLNIDRAISKAYESMNKDYYLRNTAPRTGSAVVPAKIPEFYVISDHPIETSVAKQYLRNVLENDCQLKNFRILGNELECYATISITGVGDIKVGGMIDRLDMVEEAGNPLIRIVDYKTGRYDEKKMKADNIDQLFESGTEQGYVLQTMIYSLACVENAQLAAELGKLPVKPQLLFTQKKLSNFNPDIIIDKTAVKDFRDYRDDFENGLTDLVRQILEETDFEMIPWSPEDRQSLCRRCPFTVLCGRYTGD